MTGGDGVSSLEQAKLMSSLPDKENFSFLVPMVPLVLLITPGANVSHQNPPTSLLDW